MTTHSTSPRPPQFSDPQLTRIINLSMGQGELNLKDHFFEYASNLPSEISAVFSSGNSEIFLSSKLTHFLTKDNIFIVGSATATGLINPASSEGEKVTIVAPSDSKMIRSRDAHGLVFMG